MKKVLVKIKSNALGDTIIAIPYIDKFRQENNYEVYVKVNPKFQFLFSNYPDLKFTNDENNFDEIIPIHYNFLKNIQEGFAHDLGFKNWKYIKPTINLPQKSRPIKGKYVVISIHSTSQLKYWNHPKGKQAQGTPPYWTELCGLLRKKGYTPIVVELHELFGSAPYYNGMPQKSVKKIGTSLEDTVNYIQHAEFFIGGSSGLSWLAHALGQKVVMISNFTEEWHEMPTSDPNYKRITNKSVCHGCFNKVGVEFEFDAGDWYWCPRHKDTPRQFECHTSITPDMVINQINDWIK